MSCLSLIVILLHLACISANSPPAPHQCPVPEDRARAYYNGQVCYTAQYSCCFTEKFENGTAPCCYAYGSNGPYKCCGAVSDGVIAAYIIGGFAILGCMVGIPVCIMYSLRTKPYEQIDDTPVAEHSE